MGKVYGEITGGPISTYRSGRHDRLPPLGSGLYTFKKGNQKLSQQMMRGRVIAQGFTLVVLFSGVAMTSKRPTKKRETIEEKLAETLNQPNTWTGGSALPPGAGFGGGGTSVGGAGGGVGVGGEKQ
ncbi:unnamed protein product [Discosporangium mesarthrocarpum]